MTDKAFETTPPEVLNYISKFVYKARGSMIDPCAGDGGALRFLAEEWNVSRYAIEQDDELYNKMQKRDPTRPVKAFNEHASGVYARGFMIAYVFPPPQTSSAQAVKWLEWTTESLTPEGIGIFRLHKRALHNPDFMVAVLTYFKDIQVFQDPEGLSVSAGLFIMAARTHEPGDRATPDLEALQKFAEKVEHAIPIGQGRIRTVKSPYYSVSFQFRIRGLEWEDVVEEIYEHSWPRLEVPFSRVSANFSSNLRHWRKAIEDGENPLHDLDKIPCEYASVNHDASVWCDALAAVDRGIYVLSLIGRRVHIEIVERGLKASAFISVGARKGKLIGGGSNWQENYHHIMLKLPSGGFHSVWFYRNATAKPHTTRDPLFAPLNDTVAAQMMANITGLPIPPEWADLIISKKFRVDKQTVYRVDGTFFHIFREATMKDLTVLARNDELPEPKKRQPEILRPIMPPSTGIWAQLAMQEFVNDIPLKDGIIMHSSPIELIDTEVGEALDQRIEVTEIIRKDAITVAVFHYKDSGLFRAGDWEVYQTETADQFDSEEDEDDNG